MCVMQAKKHGPLGRKNIESKKEREPVNRSRERRGNRKEKGIMKRGSVR